MSKAALKTADAPRSRLASERAQRANGKETFDALLDAALSIWSEEGIEGVTMHAVAARAGKTRGTVYHHFADRAELVLAVQTHLDERLTSLFDESMAKTRDPYLLVAGIAVDSPELLRSSMFRMLGRAPATDPLLNAARKYFQQAQKKGALHDGVNTDHAAIVGISMWFAAMQAIELKQTAEERKAEARAFAKTFKRVMEGAFIRSDYSA